jgi:predicted O-methyltransferase YrrM
MYGRLQRELRGRFPRHSGARLRMRLWRRRRERLARLWRDPLARLVARLLPRSILRDPRYLPLWERRGFHFLASHYSSPVPELAALDDAVFARRSAMVGLRLDDASQLALLESFAASYRGEYEAFPRERLEDPTRFSLANSAFGPADAEVLYCMIRRFKPQRIIEIGSGNSTRLMVQAIRENQQRDAAPCHLTAIEPRPDRVLRQGLPGLSELIELPVQQVPLSRFESLKSDDILFIDSSHVLRTGGDVQYEFLEILPRIAPGVLVHVHDIYLPAEYPRAALDAGHFYTEQYILQAFLCLNDCFEVLWAGHQMSLAHPERLRAAFPSCATSWSEGGMGASFWMRRTR